MSGNSQEVLVKVKFQISNPCWLDGEVVWRGGLLVLSYARSGNRLNENKQKIWY
jgi:hypothetical protein